MRILFLCLLLLLAFLRVVGFAQNTDETVTPLKHASLPPSFSRFSAHDVLKQVFDSYDPATGRVANILNSDHKPTLVQIDEAKLWKAHGQEYLAVLVELAADYYQFAEGGLCGNCAAYVILVVLKKEEDRISLVAKQTPPPSSVVGDRVTPVNPFEPSMIGGHSSLTLDLAFYKLNRQEALMGVRDEHSDMGGESVSLYLYRIDGQRLREVSRMFLVDIRYSSDHRTVRKASSTLSPIPRSAGFYDFEVNKTIITCIDRNDDSDCDLKRDRIKRVRRQKELWRFNGERFLRIRKPNKRLQLTAR
jgi:hypothetical protein